MEENNPGSFGAILGNSGGALKRALARRGIDASILDQTSQASPTGSNLPPNISNAPQMGDQTPQVDGQTQQIAGPAAQVAQEANEKPPARSFEMQTALEALTDVVKTENTLAKQVLKLQTPTIPQ